MKIVIILNEAPYGSERAYNGLRLAHSLQKHDSAGEIMWFLMADAVTAAKMVSQFRPAFTMSNT